MTGLAAALKSYVQADGRVCPLPKEWNRMWKHLARRAEAAGADAPPPPLILAAWHVSDETKRQRVSAQIDWALETGLLRDLEQALRSVPADGWLRR